MENWVVRRNRAWSKPLIPVHVLWCAIGIRLQVTPGPRLSNASMHFKDIANCTAADKLNNSAVVRFCMNLRAHLGNTLLLLGELSDFTGFFNRVCQWLFTVHMEVMIERKRSSRSMVVVRGADNNGIQSLLLYKLSVVCVNNSIWKTLFCNGDVLIVDITNSRDVL